MITEQEIGDILRSEFARAELLPGIDRATKAILALISADQPVAPVRKREPVQRTIGGQRG
jgi:hypothetical protein